MKWGRSVVRLSAHKSSGWDVDTLVNTGAGTGRALALSALGLYADETLWPPDRPVIVAVEEPEVGLHPAAQRAIARVLRDLPAHGLQPILFSHAASMVDTAPRTGVRCLRRARDRVEASDLGSVAAALGLAPSDILQASAFLIVEGVSDEAIFRVWATQLGYDEASDVRLVPAGSWSKTESDRQDRGCDAPVGAHNRRT